MDSMVKKTMDRQAYLRYFSKVICWRLPPDEAADVTADYAELLNARPGDGQVPLKQLGHPFTAALRIKSSKEYRCWMAVFSILALFSAYFLCGLFNRWWTLRAFNEVLFYLSVGLAALWSRKSARGRGEKRSCPGLPAALLGLLGLGAVFTGVTAALLHAFSLRLMPGEWYGPVIYSTLRILGCVSFIAGWAGLVNCRMRDGRWLSLTVLGFTLLFLCLTTVWFLRSLNNISIVQFWMGRHIVIPAMIGTMGVIWSLC